MDMLQPSIPNELLPFVLGGAVWFGCCYLYVAPGLMQRAIDLHIDAECQDSQVPVLCPCIFKDMTAGTGVVNNALFISTFGLSEPAVEWWGGERNPVIDYASLQSKQRDRIDACHIGGGHSPGTLPLSSAEIKQQAEEASAAKLRAEKQRLQDEVDAKYRADRERERRRHDEAVQAARDAQLKVEKEAAHRAQEAADKVVADAVEAANSAADKIKDSPVGDFVEGEIETAKRIYQINEDKTEEMLSWAEMLIEKSKQIRDRKMREWGLHRE